MMSADLVRAAAVVALVLVSASTRPSLAVLAPIAVVLGTGAGLFIPGSFAIIPALLPDEDLQAGNALSSGGTQLATLVGPALGGALVALVGPAPAFAVDGVSFLISALSLAGVRTLQREPLAAEPVRAAVEPDAEPGGLWRIIRSEPILPLIFGITAAANLGSGGVSEVALPALAHGPFHAGAAGYGALVAAFAGGALAGTLVATQIVGLRRPAVVGTLGFLGQSAFLAAIPFVGGIAPAAVMLVGFGALNGFSNVLTLTAFQRWTPPRLIGRLMGFLMVGSFGIFPVSVLLGGLVVHDLGAAAFFPLAAASLAATLLYALTRRAWREFGATDLEVASAGRS
jgi:predicted MFS family arabinose efflux permease